MSAQRWRVDGSGQQRAGPTVWATGAIRGRGRGQGAGPTHLDHCCSLEGARSVRARGAMDFDLVGSGGSRQVLAPAGVVAGRLQGIAASAPWPELGRRRSMHFAGSWMLGGGGGAGAEAGAGADRQAEGEQRERRASKDGDDRHTDKQPASSGASGWNDGLSCTSRDPGQSRQLLVAARHQSEQ